MASLAELHESWTLSQFTEFLRAALIAQLPDEVENPASWQEPRNRWEFLEGVIALWVGLSIDLPLLLENDPFALDLDEIGRWLQKSLARGLQDRTVGEVVRFGRNREYAVLTHLRKRYEGWSRELEEEVEATASRPGASIHDRREHDRLQSRLDGLSTTIERLDLRASKLEELGEFMPGAVGCDREWSIDLSSAQAMMADLRALADTCPQHRMIEFLRAAATLSAVPERLAHPGARMDSSALREVEYELQLASRRIGGLAAFLQRDPLVRGVDSVPERLKTILNVALQGRSMAAVVPEGERRERAFLMALRKDVTERLRRAETPEQSPERPNSEATRLRAYIKRIDGRLAVLGTEPANPEPPAREAPIDP